jgi:hypothetical protein
MNQDLPTAFASDLHAAPHIWVGRPEILGDAEFAMQQIADACIQGQFNLALGGDMTDAIDKSSVSMVQSAIERVLDADLAVGYIAGNHDPESWVATTTSMIRRIQHMTANEWRLGEHRIFGIDYVRPGDRDQLQALVAAIPEQFDILLCHQSIKPAYRFNNFDFDMDKAPAHIRQIWCGHIHAKNDIPGDGDRRLLIPGCPFLHRIDENDDHGMWVIHPDLTVRWHVLRSRPVLRLVLENREQMDLVAEKAGDARSSFLQDLGVTCSDDITDIYQEVSRPIILLKYDPHLLPGAADDLADRLRGLAHMFGLPVDSATGKVVQTLAVQQASIPKTSIRMEDCLGDFIDPQKEPLAHKGLVMTLHGDSHQDVVRELGNDFQIPEQIIEEMIKKGPRS